MIRCRIQGTKMRSICKPLLVVAFLGTVVAVPALAQPSSYPPPCDASKVSKGDVDRAHAVYLSGKQFLDESNYDKAISYFNDAYSIDCSVHAILPIIATAYERKGDKAEAVRALEEYLRRVAERRGPRARRAPDQEPERPARARGSAALRGLGFERARGLRGPQRATAAGAERDAGAHDARRDAAPRTSERAAREELARARGSSRESAAQRSSAAWSCTSWAAATSRAR